MTQEELATERLYADRLDPRDRRWLGHITDLEQQLKQVRAELAQARAADAGVQHLMDQVRSCPTFADAIWALRNAYDLNKVMGPWQRSEMESARIPAWYGPGCDLDHPAVVGFRDAERRECTNGHPAHQGKFCRECGAPAKWVREPKRWRVTRLPMHSYQAETAGAGGKPPPVFDTREEAEVWVDAWLVSTMGAVLACGNPGEAPCPS